MKTLIFLTLFTLIIHSTNAYCDEILDYKNTTIKIAQQYSYVKEKTNNNDSPEIDQWLKNVNLGPRQAYCMAYTYSMYLNASRLIKKENLTLPHKTGRVAYAWANAKKNPIRYEIITTNEIRLGIKELKPGDMPVWSRSSDETNFNGHIGLIIYQIDKEKFYTIEANTQPNSTGDQGEGGGVYYKTRLTNQKSSSFKLIGFIRIRE